MTKFKETGDSRDVYQNELDKSCFEHDLAYENLKIYLEEQFLIKYRVVKRLVAKVPKYSGY